MEQTKVKSILTKTGVVIFLAAVCGILWGSAFPSVKTGYELFQIAPEDNASKLLFAGIRFGTAGLVTILFASVKRKRICLPNQRNVVGILVLGLVQTSLQYVFFYLGLANTTGVKASIFGAVSTFFAVALAHFIYRNDKLNKFKIIGCIAGFAGVVVVNLGVGGLEASFTFQGEGFIILAALSSAVGALMSKNVAANGDSMTITGWQLLIGGGVLCLIGLPRGRLNPVGPEAFLLLGYMILLSAVAFVIWTALLYYNPVGKITVYNFMTPVFGVILSAACLGENLWDWRYLVALVLVCFGIFAVNRIKPPRPSEESGTKNSPMEPATRSEGSNPQGK